MVPDLVYTFTQGYIYFRQVETEFYLGYENKLFFIMFVESSSDDSDMDLEKVFWKKKDRTKSRSITIRKTNCFFKIFL